jgi:hypothetical protein
MHDAPIFAGFVRSPARVLRDRAESDCFFLGWTTGLLSRGSQVRVLPGAPTAFGRCPPRHDVLIARLATLTAQSSSPALPPRSAQREGGPGTPTTQRSLAAAARRAHCATRHAHRAKFESCRATGAFHAVFTEPTRSPSRNRSNAPHHRPLPRTPMACPSRSSPRPPSFAT